MADERTLRGLLSQLTQEQVEQIRQVNEAVLGLKADLDGPREVWLDFDDTIITVFGNQKGSEVGYNPRYHGRASYKASAFISGTGELVHADLYGGRYQHVRLAPNRWLEKVVAAIKTRLHEFIRQKAWLLAASG